MSEPRAIWRRDNEERLAFGSKEAQRYIAYGRQTAERRAAARHLACFFDCIGADAASISGKEAADMIVERLDNDLFDIFGDTDMQYEWRDEFFDAFKARMIEVKDE